jgi:formylglycine-generating enzyme required for sulfatase activity
MWPEEKKALYPVLHVSKNDAEAFCRWLSDLWNTEVNLPTAREWEAAAKGGPSSDRMIPGILSVSGENRHPKPVGSNGPNAKGICDLEGNVTEWISDRVEGNPFEAAGVPAHPEIGGCQMKGAYWLEGPLNPAFTRIGFKPDYRSFETGFRIVSRKAVKRK